MNRTWSVRASYGRVAPVSKAFFLQYWLFYPDNPCVLPPGRHDGDWELVQVKIERDGEGFVATQVTLAEHGKPATHPVDASRRAEGPDVFVAVGSHACYFMQGAHPALLSDVCDPAGGRGASRGQPQRPRPSGHELALSENVRGERHGTQMEHGSAAATRPPGGLRDLAERLAPRRGPSRDRGNRGATTAYVVEAGTAGHFLRRVAFVSIAFFEQRPDGTRRGLGLRKVLPGQTETFEIPHRGGLLWRAAGYNVLRQRGNPILPKPH